jgi:hypothetical protein
VCSMRVSQQLTSQHYCHNRSDIMDYMAARSRCIITTVPITDEHC